jgi:MtN3 and saliva related transmembrane protein
MNWTEIIGYLAAACTTLAFIPQAMKVFRTKDTSAISLKMYSIFIFGVATWLAFGVLKSEWPIIIANGITLLFASTILFYKIKHK